MDVRVQSADFDSGAELSGFIARQEAAPVGATVSFTGIVRDLPGGGLQRMVIEHYPGMTERAIAAMVGQARARWSLADCLVIHRYGEMRPGETIMMVATASAHRADAFAAADFLMDYLKSRAPFWKQEITAEGTAWVAARDEDEAALQRW